MLNKKNHVRLAVWIYCCSETWQYHTKDYFSWFLILFY